MPPNNRFCQLCVKLFLFCSNDDNSPPGRKRRRFASLTWRRRRRSRRKRCLRHVLPKTTQKAFSGANGPYLQSTTEFGEHGIQSLSVIATICVGDTFFVIVRGRQKTSVACLILYNLCSDVILHTDIFISGITHILIKFC